jgi:hypothetical protein
MRASPCPTMCRVIRPTVNLLAKATFLTAESRAVRTSLDSRPLHLLLQHPWCILKESDEHLDVLVVRGTALETGFGRYRDQ